MGGYQPYYLAAIVGAATLEFEVYSSMMPSTASRKQSRVGLHNGLNAKFRMASKEGSMGLKSLVNSEAATHADLKPRCQPLAAQRRHVIDLVRGATDNATCDSLQPQLLRSIRSSRLSAPPIIEMPEEEVGGHVDDHVEATERSHVDEDDVSDNDSIASDDWAEAMWSPGGSYLCRRQTPTAFEWNRPPSGGAGELIDPPKGGGGDWT
jgi:hypothetical protein